MSKEGLPSIQKVDAHGLSVAVISATWNAEVCDVMHARAIAAAESCGAVVDEIRVVGAMELPVAVQAAARRFDAVVAIGCVIRGGTPHFDYVCHAATTGLTEVSVRTGTPVGFGLLTCDTEQQGLDRAGLEGSQEDKGYEAAHAALSTALILAAHGS